MIHRPALATLALVASLLAAIVVPAHATESAAGRKDPARAITSQLICPCSCGEILSGCTCETGKSMQGFVTDELKKGKTKDEITASLVSKYGEVIRGAPKAQGFNLLVWVLPFVATGVGFVFAALVLKRWVGRRQPAGAGGLPPAGQPPRTTAEQDLADLRARAEAELRGLRE
ncbi:MAG TPA: cytochrome c-type biogenesis protein CcmH [Candidatus Eisenbacteria bacterium]|jgi:cytochrome c-type biogenesis protein CcmH/NrfF|nr:cytochrome c-type biogenesis protein CcmH [Candidatus Eisenbacteria bacterium]